MTEPSAQKRQAHCPACHAVLTRGMRECPQCKMEVARMKDYVMAMRHAQKKAAEQKSSGASAPIGKARTIVPASQLEQNDNEQRARSSMNHEMMRAAKYLIALIVVIVAGIWVYQTFFKTVDPWLNYPTDQRALLTKFFQIVHTDNRKEHEKAYALISLYRRDAKDDTQHGQYLQLFHDVDRYFITLFGPNYINEIRFEPEGNVPDAATWIAAVRTEKMTIDLEPQTPPDKQKPGEPKRWGIVAIREFPLGNSSRSQQMGAIGGVLRGLGAGGSAEQIQGIAAVTTDFSRMSPAEIKQTLMPIITNPRATGLIRGIYQTWYVRKDPTIRATLESILTDARYPDEVKRVAKQVLDERVPEEELIGMGVNP